MLLADDNTSLEAFRPSIASADAISSVTAVDLNRSGVGVGGLQAGGALNLQASASDSVRATASSVTGEATAGLNRLGGLDNLDGSPVSPVVSLSNTASFSDGATNLQAIATEAALLQAASTAGDALAEGNVQVLGSERSASSAGDDLRLLNSATLSLTAEASSTSGRAEARSGAGAGAGSSSASAALGNALPDADTYAIAAALRDGSQSAGGDLSLNANASLHLNAAASSTGGATTLSSLWSDAGGTVLSTFDPAASTPSLIGPQLLADGQQVQLDTTNATALGLDANTSYRVRLLASTAVDAAANTITMPTDITYSDGDAIRFRLNSTTAANASASRYGLELGTTYYVVGNGSTFQLATAPGGAVIDLTPDSTGLADQLVDADRFQLLQPPATPGAPATVANLTAGQSGLSLTLPSESLAFAGSRQSGPSLADPATLDLARVQGLDGSALAAGGGLLSLLAGADNAITAAADGVVTALARNTTSSATASAGLVAEGLNEVAITAAEAGTVNARATINAVAEAASTGDNALLDTSPSSLNLAARAIDAAQADQDIRLGSRGVISADAAIDGRSSATLVSGAAEALAALESTGLRAGDAGISITIGGVGDLAATARLGSAAAPVIISALSGAAGHAVAEGASQVTGILGHYDSGSSDFSALQVGTSQGDIRALASSDLQIQAVAAAGTAAASLTDVSGAAPAVVSGIHDMALSLGADLSRVESSATGRYQIEALAVGDAASVNAATSALGLLSDNATALPVDFAQNGAIAALANNTTIARALSVAGDASSNLSVSSLGLSQAALTIAGNADLDVQSLSRAANQAQSVQGNVSV